MKQLFLFILMLLFVNSLSANSGNTNNQKQNIEQLKSAAALNAAEYFNLAYYYISIKEFNLAAEAMILYRDLYSGADLEKTNAVIEILLRDDKPVKLINLGPNVNSSADEYFPRITSDGKTLYFIGDDKAGGYGGNDAWISNKTSDGWGKAYNFGTSLNTETHEGILAISSDDNVAIVFGNYEGSFGGGDLFYSVRTGDRWTLPCNMGGTINTSNWESMANLAPDGRTMLFVSDKNGSADIWVTTLTDNGWSTPINLGSTINTKGSEKYPFLSADGKTLYFASDTHPGLGGQDMFVSRRTGSSWTDWSKPVNLGKYINTVNDDQDLTIPSSGDIAFMVKYDMPDGFGGADIYMFELPDDMRPERVYSVYGKVSDENGQPVAAIIHYFDAKTGEEITQVQSKSSDGMYRATLPYGKKYFITIDMKGYLYVSDELDVSMTKDDGSRRDYTLQTIKIGLKFELKNIYFDSGKATLTEESKVELDKLFEILNRSAITIELGGHTDDVGSDAANEKLSQDRVNSVREYLIAKGIAKDRITAVGYGEKYPIATNDTDEGKQKNRRVEVKVTEIVEQTGGRDVVTNEDEEEIKKEESKFDMLSMLRYAAQIGGLPKGSPCSNEAYFYQDKPLYIKSKTYDNDYNYYTGIRWSDYIFGGFNAYVRNQAFKGGDASLGVGVNFVSEEFDELYAEYFFSTPKGVKWMANAGANYAYNVGSMFDLPLLLMLGAEGTFWQTDPPAGTDAKLDLFMNVPVGFRYIMNISGFNLGYDLGYHIGVLKSENLKNSETNSSYFRIGVNARWGMFQGGLFLNSGNFVDYFGFRAGITF